MGKGYPLVKPGFFGTPHPSEGLRIFACSYPLIRPARIAEQLIRNMT